MKKILTTILAGTLVAGTAFAVDAKITLNHRTKLDSFDYSSVKAGNVKKSVTQWMDLAGYDGKTAASKNTVAESSDMPSDSFKFVLNGDSCGTTVNVNLTNGTKAAFVLNEFSAWAKWAIGPGALQVNTGTWKDGYADGSYRVKKDVDAWGSEGMDFEKSKLGSQFTTVRSVFVDNLATVQQSTYKDNEGLSGFAEYSFDVNEDITLKALVGAVYVGEFDKVTDDDDPEDISISLYSAAFVSRLQFNMKDLLNAEFIFKKPAPGNNVFALFVKPMMVEGLDVTVGGTVETDSRADYTALAFDLRARYAINENFSITTFNNISIIDTDEGKAVGGLVGRKGAQGWSAKDSGFGSLSADPTFKIALWDCISARYKINDTFTVMGTVGLVTPLSLGKTADKRGDSYSPEWRVIPAVQIFAASNASVYAGVAISGATATIDKVDYSAFNIAVPVVFRVKM